MFGLCCKRLQLLVSSRGIAVDSVTHLHLCQISSSYSSKSLLGSENEKPKQKEKGRSFTVSYLVNSCGMSPEIALSVSKWVHFETRERPDSVIKLFKDYGINDYYISKLVKKLPSLLLVNAERILLPKLEFFGSIGLSGTNLAKALVGNPYMLTRSLEKCILPSYDLIKSILVHDEKVATFFANSKWSVPVTALRNVASNVAFLRVLQVPDSTISVNLTWHPLILCRKTENFKEDVNKVMSMGIDPSSSVTFMKALVVIPLVDASKREGKMQLYRKWGWTEDDFMLAFRKNPLFMTFSEKNFSSKMDFFLNKMCWQPADVARNPYVLTTSLEKRIIPTCSVIRVLLLKGLITKGDYSLVTILKNSEKYFLDKFVLKYQEQVPELLSIFQGKMGLAEVGLGFEDRARVNQL